MAVVGARPSDPAGTPLAALGEDVIGQLGMGVVDEGPIIDVQDDRQAGVRSGKRRTEESGNSADGVGQGGDRSPAAGCGDAYIGYYPLQVEVEIVQRIARQLSPPLQRPSADCQG